jgi:hypothetical protein
MQQLLGLRNETCGWRFDEASKRASLQQEKCPRAMAPALRERTHSADAESWQLRR